MIDIDNAPQKRIRNPGRKAIAKACAGKMSPSSGVHELDGVKTAWSRTRIWEKAWDGRKVKYRNRLTEKPYDGD